MKGIKIQQNNKEDLFLCFKSKIELKNNDFFQSLLKRYYEKSKSEGAEIKCLCKDVNMSCKYTSYYFLSNLPKNSFKHHQECIFFEHLEYLTDKDDKYRPIIFTEVNINFSEATDSEKQDYTVKENHRNNTYVNFCTDIISFAMSKTFNTRNSNVQNRGDIIYPSYKEFLDTYSSLLNNNEFLPKGSIKENLEPYHNFCFGVIEYDCLSQLQTNQNEYDIFLPKIKKSYNEDKKFLGYEVVNVNCKIKHKRLMAAAKLVQNFDNYIHPPYFFMAIYKQNQNSKDIKRLYFHPVHFDNKHIVFVDSGYERKYAKQLLDNDIGFIKPITDSCFYKLNRNFVNYQKEGDNSKRAFLQYLPDFIEFDNEHVNIVEVSGYDDVQYQNLMKRKIKHYENESLKSEGLYQVKVVDGKLL